MKIAVYPGSFDPITMGHLDVIQRGLRIFDKLIILVGDNPFKKPFFDIEERVSMIKESTKNLKNIKVESFKGLLLDYMKKNNLFFIIRGLRAVSDFDFEFQRALLNRKSYKGVETVFIMTKWDYVYLNSSIVKEIAMFSGCLKGLVPKIVEKKFKEKYKTR